MKVYVLWDIRNDYLVGVFATMEMAEEKRSIITASGQRSTMDYAIWEEEVQGL